MRSDLNKLMCERERAGAGETYKSVRRSKKFAVSLDPEYASSAGREGMQRRYQNRKSFNENLNVLKGQLRHNVGRPWNKFYSELRQNFDVRSVINQHILQHLDDFVERTLVMRNGELWIAPTRRYTLIQPLRNSSAEFYVDPRDGILKLNKHRRSWDTLRRRRREAQALELSQTERVLDAQTKLVKVDETWFHVSQVEEPASRLVFNRELNAHVREYYAAHREVRRTLSKRELRDYGLRRSA